jgi:CheY-like chemotaxis protein
MLIDDCKIDLLINKKIIEKGQFDPNISVYNNPRFAIEFFKNFNDDLISQKADLPDIIFLDINMPELSGFDFLEEFGKLSNFDKKSINIYILSSSTNPVDYEKAKKQKYCRGFINKPLSIPHVKHVIADYKIFDYETNEEGLKLIK